MLGSTLETANLRLLQGICKTRINLRRPPGPSYSYVFEIFSYSTNAEPAFIPVDLIIGTYVAARSIGHVYTAIYGSHHIVVC